MSICSTRGLLALPAVLASSTHSLAQATYRFSASPAVLAPGQTSTVTIRVSTQPSPGFSVAAGTVLGLADGSFNIVPSGTPTGTWSNLLPAVPYNGPGANGGTPAGSAVNNISWGTVSLVAPPHPSGGNGDVVWTGSFTAGSTLGPISFSVAALPTDVWVLPTPGGTPASVPFASIFHDPVVITIVPAPGALGIVAAGLAFAARRRR